MLHSRKVMGAMCFFHYILDSSILWKQEKKMVKEDENELENFSLAGGEEKLLEKINCFLF